MCHEDGKLYLGHLYYNDSEDYQDIIFDEDEDQPERTEVFTWPSYTSTDCFLIHSSCYQVLLERTASQIEVEQLFRLCQALQPDRQRNFGDHAQMKLRSMTYPTTNISNHTDITSQVASIHMLLLYPLTLQHVALGRTWRQTLLAVIHNCLNFPLKF